MKSGLLGGGKRSNGFSFTSNLCGNGFQAGTTGRNVDYVENHKDQILTNYTHKRPE